MLWFEIFSTQDRVRLWNRLVFSENYFNFIGHSSKYRRSDIRYIMAKIASKSISFLYKPNNCSSKRDKKEDTITKRKIGRRLSDI